MTDTGSPVYTMLFRPVSTFTLPRGVTTEWVRLPVDADQAMRRAFDGLGQSEHRYGEFTTNRPLTEEELERFEVRRVDAVFLRRKKQAELDERIDRLVTERTAFANDPDEVAALTREIENARSERDHLLQAAGVPALPQNR